MSNHIDPKSTAEGDWFRDTPESRNLLARERAALVLADHQPECVTKATPPAAPVTCCCGVMVTWCDYRAHQTRMLQQAGLLADGTPSETPTTRVLAERADRGSE